MTVSVRLETRMYTPSWAAAAGSIGPLVEGMLVVWVNIVKE